MSDQRPRHSSLPAPGGAAAPAVAPEGAPGLARGGARPTRGGHLGDAAGLARGGDPPVHGGGRPAHGDGHLGHEGGTAPRLAFPATVVLAPHRALLARGPTERQFGLDPDGSVVADDLPAGIVAVLGRFEAPTSAVEWVAAAADRGIAPRYAEELLGELVERGVLVDAAAVVRRETRRAAAAVLVRGDGPLAVGVGIALVRAGIGSVRVQARGHVESGDVGCGYLEADVGRARSEAAADALARIGGGAEPRRPDVVVLTDAVVPEPGLLAALAVESTDHLPVYVRDGIGVVGPLVLHGRSPCLRCVERVRAARDPAWPAVASQLTGRSGAAEPEVVTATAALGAAQVLLAIDGVAAGPAPGGAPPAVGASLELDLHGGAVRRRPWPADPGCPCGAARAPLRDRTCARAPERETIMG